MRKLYNTIYVGNRLGHILSANHSIHLWHASWRQLRFYELDFVKNQLKGSTHDILL